MKEDFVAPVRQGIYEIETKMPMQDRQENLRIYRQVQIVKTQCSQGGITHTIKFDVRGMHTPWLHSKRLIFGSLLCFSSDNFDTHFFATVANRDPTALKEGELDVHFLDIPGVFHVYCGVFDMVESPSFYEAYKHVLKALQQIDVLSMPFTNYIVEADNCSMQPKYLQRRASAIYDLQGCVTDMGEKCNVPLSRIKDWPSNSTLNNSQLEAV